MFTDLARGLCSIELKVAARELLHHGGIGEFIVREVAAHPGTLALSVKVRQLEMQNFMLMHKYHTVDAAPGITLRGAKETFSNLTEVSGCPSLPIGMPACIYRVPPFDELEHTW